MSTPIEGDPRVPRDDLNLMPCLEEPSLVCHRNYCNWADMDMRLAAIAAIDEEVGTILDGIQGGDWSGRPLEEHGNLQQSKEEIYFAHRRAAASVFCPFRREL